VVHTTKPATTGLLTLHAPPHQPHPPHTHAPHYQAKNPHSTIQEEEEKKSIDNHIKRLENNNHILHAKPKFFSRSLLRTPDHPELTVYMSFSRLLSSVVT
jgi:hypothetical protein